MGYYKTYSRSIYYSGTVSVSYPRSETGGSKSVSYSGSIPVTVDLYVDTDPFDNSVRDCSHSVQLLNGSVVAMKGSQVASIHKSADDISSHVISGFFNLIKSELSQNMSALFSKFKAVYELMLTKSEILEKQQVVMQDDYLRISERYLKIFSNLDEELEKRILALDKNVFELSKKVQSEQLYSETSKKVAEFLIGVNEDEILQQQLLIANAKKKSLVAINNLAENVIQSSRYSNKMKTMISDRKCEDSQDLYLPVIFTESSNLYSEVLDYNSFSYAPSQSSTENINEVVKDYFVSNAFEELSHDDVESHKIDDAFMNITEKEFQDLHDEKSIRVYKLIKQLKEKNND